MLTPKGFMSEEQRMAFEEWALTHPTYGYQPAWGQRLERDPNGDYQDIRTRAAWKTWKYLTSRALSSPQGGAVGDLRSIFRRIVDIIGFHNGDDSEKIEAIRKTMLTAKHLRSTQAADTTNQEQQHD